MRCSTVAPPPQPPPVDPSAPRVVSERAIENVKAEHASLAAYETQLYSIATGGLERAKNGAATVQAASTAIAALYTGVLGLVFSAQGTAFPLRGLITPLFLGVAVVLSTYYLAFILPTYKILVTPPGGRTTVGLNVRSRVVDVGDVVDRTVRRRSWAIRAGVVALAVGLVGMALPFLSSDSLSPPETSTTDASIDWPTPPPVDTSSPGEVELGKILYQGQIDHFRAHLDDKPPATNGYIENPDFFWWALIYGAAAVILVPILLWVLDWGFHSLYRKIQEKRQSTGAATTN